MNLFIDPVSATVVGWQMVGKTIEQQLRIGTVMNKAIMAPFKALSGTAMSGPTPDFTSRRLAQAPTTKAKPAPKKPVRKAAAKRKSVAPKPAVVAEATKTARGLEVVKPAPKSTAKATAKTAAPKPAAKPKAEPAKAASKSKAQVAKTSVKPPAKPEEKPVASTAPVTTQVAKSAPRRRTRAPSKPPEMPVATANKPKE